MTIQFKTREEYDQEDWARYLQKKRDISEKKRAKFEAEGFKCKVDGCGQSFRDFAEYHEHVNTLCIFGGRIRTKNEKKRIFNKLRFF